MKPAKKFRNDTIPFGNAHKKKNVLRNVWLNPYFDSRLEDYLWQSIKFISPKNREGMKLNKMYNSTPSYILEAGKKLLTEGVYDLNDFMDRYGKSLGDNSYLPNYSTLVKFCAWAVDIEHHMQYPIRNYRNKRGMR
jgi:hypothetical protein